MKKLKVVLFIIILFLISLIIVFAINKIPRCLGKILPNEDIIDAYYYVDHYSSNENQRIIKTKKIDNDKIDEFLSNVSEMKYVKYNNIFSAKGFWEGEKTLYIYYKNYEVIINEYYIYINEGIYKDDSNFDFIKRIKTVRYHKYYGFSFEDISSLFYDSDNEASLKSNPVQQLIQPINYDTFDDLINAIKNKEVPYNREEYKEEYIKYMETIYNNEYLIKLSFKDCEDVYWKTLYPKALYEDLGYSYWLKYIILIKIFIVKKMILMNIFIIV